MMPLDLAEQRILSVLEEHGLDGQPFERHVDSRGQPSRFRSFFWEGREYRLEIYVDSIVLTHSRGGLYEPYLSKELANDLSLLDGFVARLARFLSEGKWVTIEEENTLIARLWRWLGSWGRSGKPTDEK